MPVVGRWEKNRAVKCGLSCVGFIGVEFWFFLGIIQRVECERRGISGQHGVSVTSGVQSIRGEVDSSA